MGLTVAPSSGRPNLSSRSRSTTMPVGGPGEGLHVGGREAHVLQAQRLQRLEAEHIADDRGAQVRDRPGLEEVEVVGDVGEVLPRRAGHRIDAVGLARYRSQAVSRSVHTTVQVAVEDSPATAAAASSGSTPSCGVMRKSASTSVSVGDIVGVPVTHLFVLKDACGIALLGILDLGIGGTGFGGLFHQIS